MSGAKVFKKLIAKVEEYLQHHRDVLRLFQAESIEMSGYSFSVRGNFGILGFGEKAYSALPSLYEEGAKILGGKIGNYNSHFYVYDLIYKRFVLNDKEFTEAVGKLVEFYDSLEACSALLPIFGVRLDSEEVIIGDVKIIDRAVAMLKINSLTNYAHFQESKPQGITPPEIELNLVNVQAFVEVEHSESAEVIARVAGGKIGKILSLLPLLRRGWVVPDFGIGVNRLSQTYPAIAFGKISNSGIIIDFLSAWSTDLKLSQELIDASIIPQVYSILSKENPSRLERSISLASEWLANSRDQYDSGNSYICLAIALECLYSSPLEDMRTITSAIAEGVAFSIGKDLDDRKRLYSVAKKIYNTRSRIAHGEVRAIDAAKVDELYKIVEDCIRYLLSKSDVWKDKSDFVKHIEDLKFGSSLTVG